MKELKKIRSVQEMIDYLEIKGKNHRQYHHYTTWDSLQKIYENQTFLLTRGNSLSINDQHEAIMKGQWSEWNHTFIGSFTYGSAENIAMWGLYGVPWEDAVRITIPQKMMIRWISNIEQIGIWDNGFIVGNVKPISVSLTDVVYVDGKSNNSDLKLTHADSSFSINNFRNLNGIDKHSLMTGRIKNYAWHYENEVRIRIQTEELGINDRISVELPADVLGSFTIMTGPSFKWKSDNLFQKLKSEGKVEASGFEKLVNLKTKCSRCAYREQLEYQTRI